MDSTENSTSSPTTPHPAAIKPLAPLLVHAVWMSIALGIVIQLLIVLATAFNKGTILPETAGKVAWSVLVCTAIAVGNTLSKMRIGLVGLVGFLAAPAAFVIAKTVQKSLSQASSAGPLVPGMLEVAIVKALQYAIFGGTIAWLGRSALRATLRNFVITGALAGLVFGGYLVYRLAKGNTPVPPNAAVIARSINELAFPIGCSVVLWAAGYLGEALDAAKHETTDAAQIKA